MLWQLSQVRIFSRTIRTVYPAVVAKFSKAEVPVHDLERWHWELWLKEVGNNSSGAAVAVAVAVAVAAAAAAAVVVVVAVAAAAAAVAAAARMIREDPPQGMGSLVEKNKWVDLAEPKSGGSLIMVCNRYSPRTVGGSDTEVGGRPGSSYIHNFEYLPAVVLESWIGTGKQYCLAHKSEPVAERVETLRELLESDIGVRMIHQRIGESHSCYLWADVLVPQKPDDKSSDYSIPSPAPKIGAVPCYCTALGYPH